MTTTPTVAVTGATGYIGQYVVRELLANQVRIKALVRPGSIRTAHVSNQPGSSIEQIHGDLQSVDALRELVADTQVVVHLAYEHVPGRYRAGEGNDLDNWLQVNLMGTLQLLIAAQQAGVQRFIFLSSRAVYSQTDTGRLLDETHPVHPDSHYGAYKAAVEQFLRSFRAQYGMQTFSIRATGVYGLVEPIERSKWYDVVCGVLDETDASLAGGGTEVYAGDVAHVAWQLCTLEHPVHDVFHLSDQYVARSDVARIASAYLGKNRVYEPISFVPAAPLECTYLDELGVRLGGRNQLVKTVHDLVDAIRQYRLHR